jgi:uncharacterized protein (TIGR03089 family)
MYVITPPSYAIRQDQSRKTFAVRRVGARLGSFDLSGGHHVGMTDAADLLAEWPDPSRPFVTYYDAASGERVELSGTTTRNWVMKAANLLVEEADAEVGSRVMPAMPSHWMRIVWLLATWAVGGIVVDQEGDVDIAGPALDFGSHPAAHRWATALHSLGLPFDHLPPDVVDLGRVLPGMPDAFFALASPLPDDLAVDTAGLRMTYAALTTLTPTAERLVVQPADLATDIQRVVSACRGGGSFVLVTGADADELERLATQERADLP